MEVYARYLEALQRDRSIGLAHVCALHPELEGDLRRLDDAYRSARDLLDELGLERGDGE